MITQAYATTVARVVHFLLTLHVLCTSVSLHTSSCAIVKSTTSHYIWSPRPLLCVAHNLFGNQEDSPHCSGCSTNCISLGNLEIHRPIDPQATTLKKQSGNLINSRTYHNYHYQKMEQKNEKPSVQRHSKP